MRLFVQPLRTAVVPVALAMATFATIAAVAPVYAGATPPASLSATASPSSASSGQSVTVTVTVENCLADQPGQGATANIYIYPSSVGRYEGQTTTLTPSITDLGGDSFQAVGVVAVDTLLSNAEGQLGSWFIDAGINSDCQITLQTNVAALTLTVVASSTSTTTVTSTTTTPARETAASSCVQVSAKRVYAGSSFRVLVKPQCASEAGVKVNVKAAVSMRSEPVQLGSTFTGADGTFSMLVKVPVGTAPGEHTIWVHTTSVDDQPISLYQPIQVLAGTTKVPDELALTGTSSSSGWLVGSGAVALLLGSLVLSLLRRRSQP